MGIKKVLGSAVLAASLIGIGVVPGVAGAQDAIRIGDINSYKALPAFTIPYKQGVDLAVEEINAKGGVLGRPLEIVSRDDQGKPGEAVRYAEELFTKEDVVMVSGSFFSHVGLALASYAGQKQRLYLAAEPLADSLVWQDGNRYTFRLRPSTYVQASMLAEEAAKTGAKRWATIAPNYAYGKDAVAAFKEVLKAKVPDVEFVGEQWPALGKIDAAAETQALEAMKPDGIYNVTFGGDLARFVREGTLRELFKDRTVLGLLTGEPEYLDPLGAEAPEGWIVTGYPWADIERPEHKAFVAAYQSKYDDYPRLGSLVGYNTILSIAAVIEKAGSTETEAMVDAFEGIEFDSPSGPITYRALDHQSTMGAWVGKTAVKDGQGVLVDWSYEKGSDYMPPDEVVKTLRPGSGG